MRRATHSMSSYQPPLGRGPQPPPPYEEYPDDREELDEPDERQPLEERELEPALQLRPLELKLLPDERLKEPPPPARAPASGAEAIPSRTRLRKRKAATAREPARFAGGFPSGG